MLLPQTAEYALRAMAFLSSQDEAEPVRARDLSHHTSIPIHYLSKILRRLVVHNLLHSQKGHNGGFALAREASSIYIREVLAAVDYSPALDRCSFGWGQCDPENPCPLHPVWSSLNEAFDTWSNTHTLADVGAWIPVK